MSAADLQRHLQSSPVFGLAPADALADLAAMSQMHRAPAGQVVVEEGSEGDTMYLITQGRVRVQKRTIYEDTYTVSFLQAGDFFGEVALLDRDRRTATCVTETDCEFLVVDRAHFIQFGDRHPTAGLVVTRKVASQLADRLHRANQDIVNLFSALVEEVEGAILR